MDTGAPLSEDWNIIEDNQPNPALADLDGDGDMDVLSASSRQHGASAKIAWYKNTDGAGTFGVNPERNTTASVCTAAGGPDPATNRSRLRLSDLSLLHFRA